MTEPLIELRDIYKIYHMGTEEVRANDGISSECGKMRVCGDYWKIRKRKIYIDEYYWCFGCAYLRQISAGGEDGGSNE